jgi:hypothetical protein
MVRLCAVMFEHERLVLQKLYCRKQFAKFHQKILDFRVNSELGLFQHEKLTRRKKYAVPSPTATTPLIKNTNVPAQPGKHSQSIKHYLDLRRFTFSEGCSIIP